MLSSLTTLSSILAFVGVTSASFYKRDSTSITLYAYGGDLGGLSIFYADGLAYAGLVTPPGASVVSNITISEDSSDDTVAWTITANSTDASSIDGMEMYIITTTGAFSQVGFVASTNTSLPTGAVTTGFSWFGKNAAYDDPSGAVNLFYWAEPVTDTSGLWRLMWNQGGTPSNDSVPITLKLTAPLPSIPVASVSS